ncbi:MAG: hypothetical protein U5K28_10400 [Halobacteriales archaeon]|nr:hypothetical protein [Halobacteriales archaeon]
MFLDSWIAALATKQRSIWLVAVASYGVGDLLTTLVGLALGRGSEVGPAAAAALAFAGPVGIVVLKLVSLAAFYGLWRIAPEPGRVAIPLALAMVGTVVTMWNSYVLV